MTVRFSNRDRKAGRGTIGETRNNAKEKVTPQMSESEARSKIRGGPRSFDRA